MERAADLLKDAEDFLGAARDLFKTGRWAKVCFSCHQCVDLALKAALNAIGLERKGHDLCERVRFLSISSIEDSFLFFIHFYEYRKTSAVGV